MTTQQLTTQQLVTQAMMSALTVSIVASALGMMIAASGMAAIPEIPATKKGIASLREAFGSAIVNKAVKNVGTENIVLLAVEVDRLVREDMEKQYGKWATDTALRETPPGDLAAAKEVAAALARKGATPTSPTTVVEKAVVEGKARGKARARPVKDTKTGVTYKSEYAAGKAVAVEYGLDPADHFAWFKILKADPKRFERV